MKHKQKKNLIVAFIDLKKAYDKINRDALIFKLKSKGFSGKFLMSIVALVNNVLQIPKINGKLLPLYYHPLSLLLALNRDII